MDHPRHERSFSVHDVVAALHQVALRRGSCDPIEVLHALCEHYPAYCSEQDLLAKVHQSLEEGVALGLVFKDGDRYQPAGFPRMSPDEYRNRAPDMGGPATGDPGMGGPAIRDPAIRDPGMGGPGMGGPGMGDPGMGDPGMGGGCMGDGGFIQPSG